VFVIHDQPPASPATASPRCRAPWRPAPPRHLRAVTIAAPAVLRLQLVSSA